MKPANMEKREARKIGRLFMNNPEERMGVLFITDSFAVVFVLISVFPLI